MTTLIVSMVILFLFTLITLYANKGSIFEQMTSANQYRYDAAYEAAQGGMDYAIAWLSTAGNPSSAAWTAAWQSNSTYSPYNQTNATSIPAQTFGNYTATIKLWRNSAYPNLVEIDSTSSGEATATVKQIVNVLVVNFNVPSISPLMVNGCISGVTGTPVLTGMDSTGTSIQTSQPASCIDSAHLQFSGLLSTNAFTGTAWDYVFGISKSEMAMIAANQPSGATGGPIYYYSDATVGTYSPSSLGTSANPVMLIFDISSGSCPTISGGVTIYGIVYCGQGMQMQGWGGSTVYGSVITDTAITQYTANANISSDANANNTSSYSNTTPIISKLSGSWRDF